MVRFTGTLSLCFPHRHSQKINVSCFTFLSQAVVLGEGGVKVREPLSDMIVIGSKEAFGNPARYFSVSQPPHGCHDGADISLAFPHNLSCFCQDETWW